MMLAWIWACAGPPPEPIDVATCEETVTVELDQVPTWSADIAPLVATQCVGCHTDGGIAPFSLRSYADAAPWASSMATDVSSRTMPPFPPRNCATCNTFADARWLTEDQIATIVAWAAGGAPEGDADAPAPTAEPRKGLSFVQVTLTPSEPFTPDAAIADDYRCFLIPMGLTEDAFVTGFDVLPGDAREVHHVLVYGLNTDEDEAAVAAFDADDAGPGYTCFGGPGVDGTLLAGWAPGGGATVFPAETGLPVATGRSAVVQIHYNLAQGAFPDTTTVQFSTASTVSRPAQLLPISAHDELVLSPGVSANTISHTEDYGSSPATLWGVAGHMHNRGTAISIKAGDTCLLDIPDWDFHWQGLYFYEKPIVSTNGPPVTISCTYDTTADSEPVVWGESTTDEMCLGYLYVTSP